MGLYLHHSPAAQQAGTKTLANNPPLTHASPKTSNNPSQD